MELSFCNGPFFLGLSYNMICGRYVQMVPDLNGVGSSKGNNGTSADFLSTIATV